MVKKVYHEKDRSIVIQRPTQFGKHQLPDPSCPDFIGNFWLIEEHTPGRSVSGQGVNTIWYRDFESAEKVLRHILKNDLDVPRKRFRADTFQGNPDEWQERAVFPDYFEELGVEAT